MSEYGDFEQTVDVDFLGALKALAAESGTWKIAICELTDNGYDQGARSITVTIDGVRRRFQIEDDGDGCSDFSLLVGLGRRKQTSKNKIGMYGWGAKRALLWLAYNLGCRLRVESHHQGTRRAAETTFEIIGKCRAFTVKATQSLGERKGTRIELLGFKRPHVPTGKEVQALVADFGFIYSLAIEDGRTLIVRDVARKRDDRHVVVAYTPPAFEEVVEDTFKINARKSVRLRVGVVQQGQPNPKAGLHYRYGYRVIETSSSKGCGDYSVSRVFGYIDLLGDGWKLAALKDEVYEPGSLHREILLRIERVLKLAQNQQMEVESSAILANAERMLNDAIGRTKTKKAKRDRKGGRGTKTATGKGSKHEDAARKQPGETMGGEAPSPRGRIHIDFAELEGMSVGDVVGNTVRLNLRIDRVTLCRSRADAEMIYTLAMVVWFSKRGTDGHFDARIVDEVLANIGRALHSESEARVDGRRLLAEAAE